MKAKDPFFGDDDEGTEPVAWPSKSQKSVSENDTPVRVPLVLVLDNNPQLDDALIQRLQYDLAMEVHPAIAIAHRYGLQNVEELQSYLQAHPQISLEVARLRAINQSEENVEARTRNKMMHAVESLVGPMQHLAHDNRVPVGARIDAFRQLQRGAGVDGIAGGKDAKGPATGVPFVLNINFKNGQSTRIEGRTVDDPNEIPGIGTEVEDDQ